MSNLFGIGLSGLGAAQAGLDTASNNISNVNTPGYTRRRAQFDEQTNRSGQGRGVDVSGIQRQYATFLSGQLDKAQSEASATDAHLSAISRIDNQLGDGQSGLAPRMQDFFNGLSDLAAAPTDASARAAVLGDAKDMANSFNAFAGQLSAMNDGVNQQLDGAVAEVNGNARSIANLNQKISLAEARGGQSPNALLDKRDQLVAATQKLVNVDVSETDNGGYIVSVGGHALVDGNGSHALATTADAIDPSVRRLGYVDADGNTRAIPDKKASGGEIGGLLSFAHDSLTGIRNQFNQTAHVLAARVNAQHRAGQDLDGKPGGDLFTESQPTTVAAADNRSDATVSARFAAGGTQDVTADNYQIRYSADDGYQVTRASDGSAVDAKIGDDGRTLSFGGVDVAVSGQPADGDRFTVHPLDGAAASFSVAIKDTARLAAAGADTGRADNSNARALADLAQSHSVQGNRSFADNYAQLVDTVGNQTQSLQVDSDTKSGIVDELSQSQQSEAGVNLDEENVNLMYYQRMYQANARVIQTASSVFDTILGIAR